MLAEKQFYFDFDDKNGEALWNCLEINCSFIKNPKIRGKFLIILNDIEYLIWDNFLLDEQGKYLGQGPNNYYQFHRFLLVFKKYSHRKINFFIKKLLTECAKKKSTQHLLEEYAQNILTTHVNLTNKKIVSPTYSWKFANINTLPETELFFDEQVIINIEWFNDNKKYNFQGYWYTTSVEFFKKKINTNDPYYRRFVLICNTFKIEYLKKTIEKMLDEFSMITVSEQQRFLETHFEYDGQPMFYKR